MLLTVFSMPGFKYSNDFNNSPVPSLAFLGNDTVVVGGMSHVRLSTADFAFAKVAHKPTAMTLRLVDNLFPRDILLNSTVHGTKEYAPLDQNILAAIKG